MVTNSSLRQGSRDLNHIFIEKRREKTIGDERR
jgi:hypothetical protein